MMRTKIKNGIIFGIIILLVTTSVPTGSLGHNQPITHHQQAIAHTLLPTIDKTGSITVFAVGKQGLEKRQMPISLEDAQKLYEKYQELAKEISIDPSSVRTQFLQMEFANLLFDADVMPPGFTKNQLLSLLTPPLLQKVPRHVKPNPFQTKASEWFCNFATFGEGSAFPIIILPRFIPILLSPIPRAFVYWSTPEGITSVGGLISKTGFLAGGQQKGIALGFWGIGFSIFLPPIMSYGIFGYAVYTKVTAEMFEFYPPNHPPEITQTDPVDGQQMVPMTTTELRFSINDADANLMSYNVSTEPFIGSGSGGLKPDGIYSIPISGLEDLTTYTWYIEVTDGKDITSKTLTFTTEPVAPILTNPLPPNGERDVPMDLPQLQFTLKDYQGETMDYTVQTSPNIGSAQGLDVHDGTYTVPINGMTYGAAYRWYVNVTDGTHWTRKTFSFETGYPSPFNPFDYGWQYRKQITIDHTQVEGTLENLPVLFSTIDADLSKAQTDGGDILFMNGIGTSTKMHHEVETFHQSSGDLLAWINIPVLSGSEDVTFYMYYGNPSCIDQEYPEKTWDSHYMAVWHMNDATASTIMDSTKNGNDATKKAADAPVEWNGKIGKGQRYNRTSTTWEYITVNNHDSLEISGDFTITAWIYPYTTENMKVAGKHQEFSGDYKGYSINWNINGPTTKMSMRVDGGGYNYEYIYADEAKQPNDWYYMTGVKQSGINYLYIDGIQQSETGTQTLLNSDYPFCIGAWRTDEASGNFNGIIDEVRISDIGRSPEWIQTMYNSMNNPTQFLSTGPEEPGP